MSKQQLREEIEKLLSGYDDLFNLFGYLDRLKSKSKHWLKQELKRLKNCPCEKINFENVGNRQLKL